MHRNVRQYASEWNESPQSYTAGAHYKSQCTRHMETLTPGAPIASVPPFRPPLPSLAHFFTPRWQATAHLRMRPLYVDIGCVCLGCHMRRL